MCLADSTKFPDSLSHHLSLSSIFLTESRIWKELMYGIPYWSVTIGVSIRERRSWVCPDLFTTSYSTYLDDLWDGRVSGRTGAVLRDVA